MRYESPAQLKGAVIGYSGAYNMGRAHLNEMLKAGMVPTAVCEVNPERLAAARQDFPEIETYSSIDEMLEKSDANLVAIITPHNMHRDQAMQCMKAGRHVVCEKPFAMTTAECDEIIETATKNSLLVSTYHNRHWDGSVMQAVKTIESGAIGDVVRIEAHAGSWGPPGDWWRASKSISGGILLDWGVHLLEYSFQIIKGKITEVSGFSKRGYWGPKSKWLDDTNEDEAFVVVRFDSGQWLTLCISSIDSNPKRGAIEVTGTEGTYIMEHRNWETITHADGQTIHTKGVNPQSEGWQFYGNIAEHLTKGSSLVITPEWARRPIHVLDLAHESAAKGRTMQAKYF